MTDKIDPAITALEAEDPLATHKQMVLPLLEAADAAFDKLVELHGTDGTGNVVMMHVDALLLTTRLLLLEKHAPPEHHARLFAAAVRHEADMAKLLLAGKTIGEALDQMVDDAEAS